MTPATKHIHEAAQYVQDSQFVVSYNSTFSWVHMKGPGEAEVFLQGQEADEFLDETKALCRRFRSLDLETAVYARCKPYIDCLD